ARRVAVRAGAVYRFAPLPKLGLVAGVGIYPHEVFVFDLATGSVHPLGTDLEAFWCVSDEERSELFVVGTGGISRYAFTAQEQNGRRSVTYRLATRRATDLGLMSATVLPDGSLWAATSHGTLLRFPKDAVPFEGHVVSGTAF